MSSGLIYVMLLTANAADTADIWLCIRCYNDLFLSQPQAAVAQASVITVRIHTANIYLTHKTHNARSVSHTLHFGHLHNKSKINSSGKTLFTMLDECQNIRELFSTVSVSAP